MIRKYLLISTVAVLSFSKSFCQEADTLVTASSDTIKVSEKKGMFKTSWGVLKNTTLSVPGDFVNVGQEFSKDWKKTAIYTGGIIGLTLVDKYTTEFYQNHVERMIDYKLPDISPKKVPFVIDAFTVGKDAYLTYSLLGLYAGSFVTKYETGQYAVLNSFKAMAYSYVISHMLFKSIIGRQRPDPTLTDGIPPEYPYTSNPFEFHPFHGINFDREQYGTAMPSFHATAYFAVAKVLAMEFDNYWIPYTAVGVIFFGNIKGHKHWVSDMVAGGILGTIIGRSIVKSSRRMRNLDIDSGTKTSFLDKVNFQLVPQISPSFVGMHLVGTF